MDVISTGLDVKEFTAKRLELQLKKTDYWLPYIVVELAPYDDSLLRQIHHQPQDDPSGLFRLPNGEVISMALQLLDVMQYLHTKYQRAYMDWKPEHIHWNGLEKQVKLIDWNVTAKLEDTPGNSRNIMDDIRIFCGAALYVALTFVDPEDPTKPIGPRPTRETMTPIPEIRRRYWTDNPNFHQRDATLDEKIKRLIRKGLDPDQGYDSIQKLKNALIEYAEDELGLSEAELTLKSQPQSPYFKALTEVHNAQQQLLQAQQHLYEAIGENGSKSEFTRMFDAIKRALMNFPIS
jgi:serine/threonine protein kinase